MAKPKVRLGKGEFSNLYDFLKAEWDLETAKGIHGARGFQANLSAVLKVRDCQVANMIRKRLTSDIRLTARQWTALASRFSVRVDTLLMLAYGYQKTQLKAA